MLVQCTFSSFLSNVLNVLLCLLIQLYKKEPAAGLSQHLLLVGWYQHLHFFGISVCSKESPGSAKSYRTSSHHIYNDLSNLYPLCMMQHLSIFFYVEAAHYSQMALTVTAWLKKSSASLGFLHSSHVFPVLLAIWETHIREFNNQKKI